MLSSCDQFHVHEPKKQKERMLFRISLVVYYCYMNANKASRRRKQRGKKEKEKNNNTTLSLVSPLLPKFSQPSLGCLEDVDRSDS